MRVLVTGVAGFIGSRVASHLLRADHEVVGVDALTTYYDPAIKRRNVQRLERHRGFQFVESDLLEDTWVWAVDHVDAVLHHAAEPGVRASWEHFDRYVDRNVHATQRLLELVRERPLRRFVMASSSSVYGDALHFPTREDVLPQPFSPYGVTKMAAEQLCHVYARNWGVPTVTLRYFTVYGGGQRPDMAVQRMIQAARHGLTFKIFGQGTQERDLTHVDDVARANLAALEHPLDPGECLNVAGGDHVTVNELLERVGKAVGSPVPAETLEAKPGDVRRTGADTSRARQRLGVEPATGLEEGIAEQVDWVMREEATRNAS